ncbi:unnamed protein product [Cochlearia groenlandica]
MAKKKELLSNAPWRGGEDESDKFSGGKLKVTKESEGLSKMHVPSRGNKKTSVVDEEDDSLEIDPQLRYSFNRNYQFLQSVFTIDTLVKPLPPTMAYNASRNLSFFTRIFTQFFDPEGIANAQKSLGLGQEEKSRRVS